MKYDWRYISKYVSKINMLYKGQFQNYWIGVVENLI